MTNTLRLLQLPAGVQRLLAEGQITPGHARALLGHPGPGLPGGPGQVDRGRRADRPGRRGPGPRARRRAADGAGGRAAGRSGCADGADGPSGRRAGDRSPSPAAPGVLELEELLSSHLNTRVKVDLTSKRGKVVVEFATLEDLERIYKLMVGGTESAARLNAIPRRVVIT